MRIALFLIFAAAAVAQQNFDLVVYGGTAGQNGPQPPESGQKEGLVFLHLA